MDKVMHNPEHPLTLIRGGHVFAPQDLGVQDILIAGGRIVAIDSEIEAPANWGFIETVDASELLVLPGFIDAHVHIIGGGGEGGPETRNRDILLGSIIAAGVTSVVGCIGVDCETRSVKTLLAKARALTNEGISAYVVTGGYVVPTPTLTGSITTDIAFIPDVLGVGEIAIADHRSSHATVAELAKIASAARMGALLGKKAGIMMIHVGDGAQGLSQLRELLEQTEIPIGQFLPTHINRNACLFEEATAYAKQGGVVDVTAGISPHLGFSNALKPSQAIVRMVDAGVDLENITLSSDANGNWPVHDAEGRLIGLEVQAVTHLYDEIRDLVSDEDVPLSQALQFVTTNVARVYKLGDIKGRLVPGHDADLVLAEPDLTIRSVYAKGNALMKEGEQVAMGMYERSFKDHIQWRPTE